MARFERVGVRALAGFAPALLALVLAGCGEDDDGEAGDVVCGEAVGNWRFGDGNLFMSVSNSCEISNFCSIRENIHTKGTASATQLKLDSVGGSPLAFFYTVSADQLTIIDGFEDADLQLDRLTEALPATCPAL
jgi:hypothetical protein